jgi:ribonucleoside-diphosphate reductase alpha chain
MRDDKAHGRSLMTSFDDELARWVWEQRYRWHGPQPPADADVQGTRARVARAVAAAEPAQRAEWERKFLSLLSDWRFLPGGRILAGAGTGRSVTLLNCFVMGRIEDSMPGIFAALQESAVTLQLGGGIGCDFSTLRPQGTSAKTAGTTASGPVSFMHVWNSMCATVLASGNRRGAMMATLRIDHPDILEFIDAKRDPSALRFFNLSVQVSDRFLEAVRRDEAWPLVYPVGAATGSRVLPARELWQRLLDASYDSSEPGVLFVDTINRENNLAWRETLTTTNPCGEVPLPEYGACNLGSINLARFVRSPFTATATLDLDAVAATAALAVRFLDDVLDVTKFPLPQQAEESRATRRIGLGITGLADALCMLGLRYESTAAREIAAAAMRALCLSAYGASVELAAEKGTFPAFDRDRYLAGRFVQRLPAGLRDRIAAAGIRNSHLTVVAPAGTISLLAGNLSSGIEPIFEFDGRRRVLDRSGRAVEFPVTDHAVAAWRGIRHGESLGSAFVTATGLEPEAHLAMQAAVQPWVDGAISKTINLPSTFPRGSYASLYERAHALGLKGCTTYRAGTRRGQVVSPLSAMLPAERDEVERCCSVN